MDKKDIQDISRGYWKSEILFVANRLGVFDLLNKKAVSGKVAAESLKVSEEGVARLMDALVALKLLNKKGNRYSNSTAANRYLVAGKPLYLGNSVRHAEVGKTNWSGLERSVRTGKPVATEVPKKDLKWRRRLFIMTMRDLATHNAPHVVQSINARKYRKLVDLGCGSGLYARAFCEKNKKLHVTLFDKPDVIELAKEILTGYGALNRMSFQGGDLLTYDFGRETFDAFFISNIVHIYNKKENVRFFKKIHAALTKGGEIIIQDFVMNSSKTAPEFAAYFRLNMFLGTAGGDNYSYEEYKKMLKQSFFHEIRLKTLESGSSLIFAKK